MSIITNGLDGFKLLLGDIIVCGRTKAEPEKRLEALSKRLHDYNFLINDDKSFFCVLLVDFVSHTVCLAVVQPLKSNINGIVKFVAPTSCKKARSLLKAANFCRK